MTRRGRVVLIAAALVTLVTVGVVLWRTGQDRVELPAPASAPDDTAVAFEDFVGSEACAPCHAEQTAAWRESTHGRAGGRPTADRVIAPFDGRPLRFSDAVVTPDRAEDGTHVFRVRRGDLPEETYRVARVVGGGFMVGGGTQAYFAEFPDGTLRFLPFDYIRQEDVWFCNTNGRTDRGWVPITPDMSLTECSDWPPTRVLGAHKRFWNCQNCHGSQIHLSYDTDEKRYETRFTTLAVNCESCHGPGRRHVERARAGDLGGSAEIGMRALETLDVDASLQVCFQCHAVKEELRPGYLPGQPLEDHFGLMLPLLSFRPYYPDGRIRLFAYQQTHLFSDCYANGSMTCVDCHDPHSQGYRDIYDRPLPGRFDDGQCLDCHPSKAEPVERHTHHPEESPGSRCVACHMPYLQEPDVGDRLRYARSDHTIPIPRPTFDESLGIRNACGKCHADRSTAQLQDRVETWYGTLKPVKPLVAGLIRAQRVDDRVAAARLMLAPDDDYDILKYSGLAYYFLRFLEPDMPRLEPEVIERLRGLASADDPDRQALALASLHFARGDDSAVREYLAEQLAGLGANDRPVRERWAWVLSFRADAYRDRRETRRALDTYRKALEILPGDPELLHDIGVTQIDLQQYEQAAESFRQSLAADPERPLTLVNLGSVLTRSGRFEEGYDMYRQALELNPREPLAYVSLGNALLRQGSLDNAIEAYRRALALDPSRAEAHFSMGMIFARRQQYDRAIASLRRGLAFDRGNRRARETLQALLQQRGGAR